MTEKLLTRKNMRSIIMIYLTDPWHTHQSEELIGIATTEKKRDKIIRHFLNNELDKKPAKETLAHAMCQIKEIGQTQCLTTEFDVEINTETIPLNEIIY